MTMPSDTPTPALTLDEVLHHLNAMAAQINTAVGFPEALIDTLREEHFIPVRDSIRATMTERDTLRSEVERLTPPEFTPIADSDGVFRKVYNGAMFETSEGNRYGVCMRDDTIEVIPVGDAPMPRVFPNQPATPQPPTAPECAASCTCPEPCDTYDPVEEARRNRVSFVRAVGNPAVDKANWIARAKQLPDHAAGAFPDPEPSYPCSRCTVKPPYPQNCHVHRPCSRTFHDTPEVYPPVETTFTTLVERDIGGVPHYLRRSSEGCHMWTPIATEAERFEHWPSAARLARVITMDGVECKHVEHGFMARHDTPPTSKLPDSLDALSAHADEDRTSEAYKEQMRELTSELPEEESCQPELDSDSSCSPCSSSGFTPAPSCTPHCSTELPEEESR